MAAICSLTENIIIKESVIFSLIPIESPCRVHYVFKTPPTAFLTIFEYSEIFLPKIYTESCIRMSQMHAKIVNLHVTLVYKVNEILLLKLFLRLFVKNLILLLILLKTFKNCIFFFIVKISNIRTQSMVTLGH